MGEMLVRIDQFVMSIGSIAGVMARLLACIIAICGTVQSASPHEIPSDVKINAFVKPSGNRLELLLRVPMGAMREVEFPTRGPGYIDMPRVEEALRNAAQLWFIDNIDVYENDARVGAPRIAQVRVSLPSDKSFSSYEEARRHLEGPRLADDVELYWNQQLLDVLLEFPIRSERSEFALDFRVGRFGIKVETALLFLPPDGAVRAFEFHGDPLDAKHFHCRQCQSFHGKHIVCLIAATAFSHPHCKPSPHFGGQLSILRSEYSC